MSDFIKKLIEYEEKVAIIDDNKSYSYKELVQKTKEWEKLLKQKSIEQKTVAILGDYSFDNITLFLALYTLKNIIVPITTTIKTLQEEFIQESFCEYVIKDDDIIKVATDKTHPMIENLISSKHSGLVLFSSGSTGKPKAMIHNLDKLIDSYLGKRAKNINMLLFLMFDHIGGLNTLFNALSIGASVIIPKNKDATTICALIERYKIAILPSSPTFLNLLLISKEHTRYDLSSLRMITYGTETMPESLLLKLKEQFPKVRMLQTFGTSETGISTTSSKSSNSLYMKLDGVEQRVVDGELWLKSDTQILGYLNSSMESFTSDGWFKTGDLVEIDGEYIKIIGRAKEVINVGGQKVLPSEVESLILQLDIIDDVMVYGETNAITGQTVVCDVVLNKEIENIKKTIRLFCKNKLEPYKIPTKVHLVLKTNFADRFKKIRRKV
ncbi:MAG: fatty acid--CoA ligase family protein [Arcobacteraceae bacterium]|jgi:acyl-CoA synthetase (AMP-forming)/AMP-acid ligase II|nr:fatty acid--CoA ligase family protein [Arcobacteraceae bacterium]